MVSHTMLQCLTAVRTDGMRPRKRGVGVDEMNGAQCSIILRLGLGWARRTSEVPVAGEVGPDQAKEGEEAVVCSSRNTPSARRHGRSCSRHHSTCPCTCTPLRSLAGHQVRTESRTQVRRHHQLLLRDVRRRQRVQDTATASPTYIHISAKWHRVDLPAAGSSLSAIVRRLPQSRNSA